MANQGRAPKSCLVAIYTCERVTKKKGSARYGRGAAYLEPQGKGGEKLLLKEKKYYWFNPQ